MQEAAFVVVLRRVLGADRIDSCVMQNAVAIASSVDSFPDRPSGLAPPTASVKAGVTRVLSRVVD
jgi:hypothetical protein